MTPEQLTALIVAVIGSVASMVVVVINTLKVRKGGGNGNGVNVKLARIEERLGVVERETQRNRDNYHDLRNFVNQHMGRFKDEQ